ncbi:MAG TPA: lysylphosphatidylglycerol synthase transmembrane domain-containing protein [Gaiellales bacterium]
MSAVPALPSLAPARRLAGLAQSRLLHVVLGASALAVIGLSLARRVDLGTLADSHIVWAWIAASLFLNLASVAGKAVVWKAALDALPEHRPVRYGHVVPALFIGFLLNTVLFARIGELARVAVLARRQRLAGESIPATTIGGTAVAEQLVLGVALALAVVALAPVLHLPHLIWQLVIAFVLVLAAVSATLVLVLRNARGRLAGLLAGVAKGQALFTRPRATTVAIGAGVVSWAAQIAGIWAALEAFHIHVGLAGAGLVFVSSTIVQIFPFWPGNLGIFQLGVAGPLVSAYGVATTSAVAFSVGLQLVEGILGVGLGLVFLAREGLSLSGARQLAKAPDDAIAIAVGA